MTTLPLLKFPSANRWLLIGFLAVTPSSILAAQDSSAAELAWRRLPSNSRLRIHTSAGPLVARFMALTVDTIYLRGCEQRCQGSLNGQIRFPRSSLTRVEVQHGHRTVEGFVLGVLVGGALGAGIGLAVGEQGDMRQGDMMLAVGLTGGLAGAILGPIIGSGKERWKQLRHAELSP